LKELEKQQSLDLEMSNRTGSVSTYEYPVMEDEMAATEEGASEMGQRTGQ